MPVGLLIDHCVILMRQIITAKDEPREPFSQRQTAVFFAKFTIDGGAQLWLSNQFAMAAHLKPG